MCSSRMLFKTTEPGWGPEMVQQEEKQVMRDPAGARTDSTSRAR